MRVEAHTVYPCSDDTATWPLPILRSPQSRYFPSPSPIQFMTPLAPVTKALYRNVVKTFGELLSIIIVPIVNESDTVSIIVDTD